jgi:hypothetical protein
VIFRDQLFQARRQERWLLHRIWLEGNLRVSFFHAPIESWFFKKEKGLSLTFETAPQESIRSYGLVIGRQTGSNSMA